MKSPAEYMASRRRSEDKSSWKDQLSPRIKSFRRFSRRRSSVKTPQRQEPEFQIVHFPDRPARRITQEEIPSEEECREFLLQLRRGSLQSHAGTEVISGDGEEEQEMAWESKSAATRLGLAWQTPGDARSEIAEEGVMTARTYSPYPYVGEAKGVKLERLRTSCLRSRESSILSVVTPLSPPPRPKRQESAINHMWNWTMPPAQPSRSSTMRHSLRSHEPHVRQSSGADPLCRVCHVGLAELSGICQTCSDEYTISDEPQAPKYTHAPPSRSKAAIPPTLNQTACQRRATFSFTPSLEETPSSSPTSPSRRTVHTVVTLQPKSHTPLTPLSGMPTPQVLARLERGPQEDVYDDDWADYYFDDENFNEGEEEEKEEKKKEVDPNGFMLRELSLEEYDRAFASPVSPGAGWI